jgi:RimJ/RimL family protein N-acetyltransferase
MSFPELETERLRLRMFCHSDTDAYADMCADPEIMRFLGDGKPMSRDMAWRNMATVMGHWHLRGYGFWAVEEKSTGELVGRVGCWNPEGWPGIEVGWTILRAAWGQGFAVEAGRAAMDWAFQQLNLESLSSVIRTGNDRSVRVAEKLGESWDYTLELMGYECQIYTITREKWARERSANPA